MRPTVRPLHEARTATGDHGVARLNQCSAELAGLLILRGPLAQACGTEHGDCPIQIMQRIKTSDEL